MQATPSSANVNQFTCNFYQSKECTNGHSDYGARVGVVNKTGPPGVTASGDTVTDGLGFVYSPNGQHTAVTCPTEVRVFKRCVLIWNGQRNCTDATLSAGMSALSVLKMNNVSHLAFSPKGST